MSKVVNQKRKSIYGWKNLGESEMEELVPEWCWRRDKGSNWFQRQVEALSKGAISYFFIEKMMLVAVGRARVTTDKERVGYGEDVEQRWGYEGVEVE